MPLKRMGRGDRLALARLPIAACALPVHKGVFDQQTAKAPAMLHVFGNEAGASQKERGGGDEGIVERNLVIARKLDGFSWTAMLTGATSVSTL
jgi:hypothetical protein